MIDPKLISELVDEIALDKPLNWEEYNFDSVKELAVIHAVETYAGLIDKEENFRDASLVSIIAYLMAENTVLWIENSKGNK